MKYLALIASTTKNYSGWIPDFDGAIWATAPTLEKLCERLSQALALYFLELETIPAPRAKQLKDIPEDDLEGYETAPLLEFIEPALVNPVSLEIAQGIENRGLNKSELARRLGVTAAAVGRLADPFYWGHSLSSIRKVANELNASLEVKLKLNHKNKA